MATLDGVIRDFLDGDPQAEAIEYRSRWYRLSEVRSVAGDVARLLDEAGLDPRTPVGFVPRNHPSAIAAELGMVAARRTIRMIYAFQSTTGIARDIERLKVGAVVAAAEDMTPEVLTVCAEQGLAAIALHDTHASLVEGAERSTAPLDDAAPPEPQIQVHTSGTTGPPKHVGFGYDTLLKYIVGQNMAALGGSQVETPALLAYPLGNISGIYTMLPAAAQRRRLVLLDRFTLDGWLDYVRRFRPAAPVLPPAAMSMILDEEVPREALDGLSMILTGAAPLDPTVQRAFEERYRIPVLVSYGATEFGGPVAAMTPELYETYGASKRGTVGRPFAGARFRVTDQRTGEELSSGTEGVLEVMAPRIGDHWIRTTDIAMVDEDGFLFLRGRADGAIIRGGFKLLPETIERALCLHPAVSAAAVVGIADRRLGQVPAAAVQIGPGHERPTTAELERHLRQHVLATHIPVAWTFVDALPCNASFKIDLHAVRAMFSEHGEPALAQA